MTRSSKQSICEGVQHGIIDAHKGYASLAGHETLYYAPEYMLTVAVAKRLKRLGGSWVTLESNVDETMAWAESKYIGRPRDGLRKDGRFDIVLWNPESTRREPKPRAIVEIKHRLYQPTDVFLQDIERLRDAILTSRRSAGSLEFGCFGFWTGSDMPIRKHDSATHRIEELFSRLVEAANKCVLQKSDLRVRPMRMKTKNGTGSDEPWAWGAGCIVIE